MKQYGDGRERCEMKRELGGRGELGDSLNGVALEGVQKSNLISFRGGGGKTKVAQNI